jgi:hypothetical protein
MIDWMLNPEKMVSPRDKMASYLQERPWQYLGKPILGNALVVYSSGKLRYSLRGVISRQEATTVNVRDFVHDVKCRTLNISCR